VGETEEPGEGGEEGLEDSLSFSLDGRVKEVTLGATETIEEGTPDGRIEAKEVAARVVGETACAEKRTK
jgi:hypothetical protein